MKIINLILPILALTSISNGQMEGTQEKRTEPFPYEFRYRKNSDTSCEELCNEKYKRLCRMCQYSSTEGAYEACMSGARGSHVLCMAGCGHHIDWKKYHGIQFNKV